MSGRDLGVRLFHNEGNGVLLRVTNAGPILSSHSFSGGAACGDYDGDGFLDLFVPNGTFAGDLKSFLFHNQGNGTFAKVTTGSVVNDLYDSWAGYDDDGRLDLFVISNGNFSSSGLGEDNRLYHNDGPAGFTRITAAQMGVPAHDGGYSRGCAWVDYDNDGFLDLFVVKVTQNNFLYHNNGHGTFTPIKSGSLVNDGTALVSLDCAWADYDSDGFMDLVIAADDGRSFLFHNNGNTNHWINLKRVGTDSNRSAIGAKVRVLATIGGRTFWQRHDIAGGGSVGSQFNLRASFGLGDATNIDIVRIEWPSGTVQELHNLGTKQFLTVTEPARLKDGVTGGQYQLILNGGVGFTYGVDVSANLVDWTSLTNLTTTNMTLPLISLDAAQAPQKYFRTIRR